jgi:hypothetical protein
MNDVVAFVKNSAPLPNDYPHKSPHVNGKAKVSQRAEQNVATFGLA